MYVVVISGSGDVKKFISKWRWNYRYRHREVDWAVFAEQSISNGVAVVFNSSFLGLFGALKVSEIAMGLGFTARIYWLDVFYSPDSFFEEELREYAYMGATGKDIERVVKGRLSSRLPEVFSMVREDRVYGFGAYTLGDRELKLAVTSWRSNVKARLPESMRGHVLLEAFRSKEFIVLLKGSLLSLLFISRLEKIFRRKAWSTRFYRGTLIEDAEKHIDEKLREKIEKIPPHLVHDIRKALVKRRLPKGKQRKEIIEAMQY